MVKKTLPVDVLKSLGVTDKPKGSSVAKPEVERSETEKAEAPVAPQADRKPELPSPKGQGRAKPPRQGGVKGGDSSSERLIDNSKRMNIYLTPKQHQELRLLSVKTGKAGYLLCIEAMVKAGMISE